MDGSGAFIMTPQGINSWITDGTPLQKAGESFGRSVNIVGYETDGCHHKVTAGVDGRQQPEPTGTDGTPSDFVIVGQCSSASWGTEWTGKVPSMERYAGEGLEVAVEAGMYPDGIAQPHAGTATCGYIDRRAAGGGFVFAAGTTDWVYGLNIDGDATVKAITQNILRTMSA